MKPSCAFSACAQATRELRDSQGSPPGLPNQGWDMGDPGLSFSSLMSSSCQFGKPPLSHHLPPPLKLLKKPLVVLPTPQSEQMKADDSHRRGGSCLLCLYCISATLLPSWGRARAGKAAEKAVASPHSVSSSPRPSAVFTWRYPTMIILTSTMLM